MKVVVCISIFQSTVSIAQSPVPSPQSPSRHRRRFDQMNEYYHRCLLNVERADLMTVHWRAEARKEFFFVVLPPSLFSSLGCVTIVVVSVVLLHPVKVYMYVCVYVCLGSCLI